MFVMNVPPDVPPQYAPVVIAEASQAKQQNTDRTIGVCKLIDNRPEERLSAVNALSPAGEAYIYLTDYEKVVIDEATYKSASISLLQAPKHGELEIDSAGRAGYFVTTPDYIGPDRATVLVEIGKYKVKVIYHFNVMRGVPPAGEQGRPTEDKRYCPNGRVWKISLNPDDPNAPIYTFDSPTQLTTYLAGAINVDINITDLAGGAVGQTTGTTITLDDNAAVHGWFIDTTPGDNAEYLPTHNPNEWIAKTGSAAAGKLDMLSVLLHEYGHVLGIDHSADNHDYMATTLTPGVRRMPSSDELALMAKLVGELKHELVASTDTGAPDNSPLPFPWLPLDSTLGIAFLGRLRSRLSGQAADNAALTLALSQRGREVVQYAVAANATLENGSLDLPQGWLTQGSVEFTNGAAVLNEVSNSQTRLSQVFMVGAQDHYLSFTLGGTVLDDQLIGPDDAFEAALLDANTGASLASALSLTRTDALLNLQANGTERLSPGPSTGSGQAVTRTDNPDGSRTYLVDLTGIAAGTAVNLSFDLIGFGQTDIEQHGSRVTLDDVRLLGANTAPTATDDSVTTPEDQPLTFNMLANDQDAEGDTLTPSIVQGPTHGTLTANADGTFTYTPNANYFGADSFTYLANDGKLDSNLATVSITIAPVNDAPVVADVGALEDTPYISQLADFGFRDPNDTPANGFLRTACFSGFRRMPKHRRRGRHQRCLWV
jgi:VCBS repeat-containing protein